MASHAGKIVSMFILIGLMLSLHLKFSKNLYNNISVDREQVASTNRSRQSKVRELDEYKASSMEDFVFANAIKYGFATNQTDWKQPPLPRTCAMLEQMTHLPAYLEALSDYTKRVAAFNASNDIRVRMRTEKKEDVCQSLRVHPDGLSSIFRNDTLSYLPSKGHMEPLIPPLRDPRFCTEKGALLSLEYLVHDFEQFCQSVVETSRFVLIDMGASLNFHPNTSSPVVYLTETYRKFGFRFDHIYAYEVTFMEPDEVFELIPNEFLSSYHWINRPVSSDPASRHNPFNMILAQFEEDDFIVVKLDIDFNLVEVPLARQLLNNASLYNKVDIFYFEHHVLLGELAANWKYSCVGTVKESFDLFQGLRRRGIAAHSWV